MNFLDNWLNNSNILAGYIVPARGANSPLIYGAATALMAITATPLLMAVDVVQEGIHQAQKAIEVAKRLNVSEKEKEITSTFGRISIIGYPHYGGGLELTFDNTKAVSIHADGQVSGPLGLVHEVHSDRKEGVKNLLGDLASAAARQRDNFIVVKKEGETSSSFYRATEISNLKEAPENTIMVATHRDYKITAMLTPNEITKSTDFAISPVDAQTATRLRGLGL